MRCEIVNGPFTFSLPQSATSSTSSTLVSVWGTALTGTLPASSSRSAFAATPIVPRAAARAPTTVARVATPEPSVTKESVCPSAAATLTTTRTATNAEVGQVHNCLGVKKKHALEFFCLLDCDRSCLTCSGHGPSSCLTCDNNRRKDDDGQCVWLNQCDLTSYMDQNSQCHPCHRSCHRCSGPAANQCLSCNKPSFLLSMCVGFFFCLKCRV